MTLYNAQGVEVFDFKPPKTKKEIRLGRKLNICAPMIRFRPERVESKGKDEL